MDTTLDLISIGRSSVDLYGQQIGSRLEDIGSFAKSVGGCPANIAIGTARLGLEVCADHAGGRRADGELHPRTTRSRGRRDRRRSCRQGSLVGAGAARRAERGRLADDLLSLRLRRHGAGRKRHPRGPRRSQPRGRRDRNPLLEAGGRRRAGESDRAGEEAWRQGGVRHRLSAEPLGPRRPRGGFRALREVGGGVGAPQDRAPRLRPDRRHGRGDHGRRRRRQRARRAEGHPRDFRRDRRAQTRRSGLHRL